MTGYAARLVARAVGAAASEGPAVMLPPFVPRFLPVIPDAKDVPYEPAGAVPPVHGRAPVEPSDAVVQPTRAANRLEGSSGADAPVSGRAKPGSRMPVSRRDTRAADRAGVSGEGGGRTADRASLAREDPGESVAPGPNSVPSPVIIEGSHVDAVPVPFAATENAMEQVPVALAHVATGKAVELPRREIKAAPVPPPVMAAPGPEARGDLATQTDRIEAPHVSIGRIDLIFEDPTPPAPRSRAAPDRTSGFDAYDRLRSGHRR